jgi:hypothetical protein
MTGVVVLGLPLAFVGWYVVASGSMAFAGCASSPGSCNYALGNWTLGAYPFIAGLIILAFATGIWSLRDRASSRRLAGLALGALLALGVLTVIAAALVSYAARA